MNVSGDVAGSTYVRADRTGRVRHGWWVGGGADDHISIHLSQRQTVTFEAVGYAEGDSLLNGADRP